MLQQRFTPRIAVLLCTHNGEKYLQMQLRSIADQTSPPALVFIHDWGSTDGTRNILSRYAQEYAGKLKVLFCAHDEIPGPKNSFVRAIQHSVASKEEFEYLALCDQDDLWEPAKLRKYADHLMLRKVAPDILYSDASLINDNGVIITNSYYRGSSPFRPLSELRDPSLVLANPVIGMTMCASRTFLHKISPLLNGPWLMHDWALVLLASSMDARMEYLPEPLVQYRQHADNILGASRGLRLVKRLRKARSHFSRLRQQAALLEKIDGNFFELLIKGMLRQGAFQRFRTAKVALRSKFLNLRYRLLLCCSILMFW